MPAPALSMASAHRSVRRWLFDLLPDPEPPATGAWTVTLQDRLEDASQDRRPLAVVRVATPPETGDLRIGGRDWDVRYTVTFGISLYPSRAGTAEEATHEGTMLADLLSRAIVAGVYRQDDDREIALPGTLPFYDFDGVPVVGPHRAGPTDPVARLDVLSSSFRAVEDEDDDRLMSVQGTIRVRWFAPGPRGSEETVQSVREDPPSF